MSWDSRKIYGRKRFLGKRSNELIMGYTDYVIDIHEQRELNYMRYRQLMKNDRLKVKIREGEPEDKPKQRIKK